MSDPTPSLYRHLTRPGSHARSAALDAFVPTRGASAEVVARCDAERARIEAELAAWMASR